MVNIFVGKGNFIRELEENTSQVRIRNPPNEKRQHKTKTKNLRM